MKLPLAPIGIAMASGLFAQTVSYTYDKQGRLSSVTYPNKTVLSYTYDPSGNLLQRLVSAPPLSPASSTEPASSARENMEVNPTGIAALHKTPASRRNLKKGGR